MGADRGDPARRATGDPAAADALDLEEVERELRARTQQLHDRLAGFSRPPERGADISFGKRIGDGTAEAVSRLTEVGVGRGLEVSEARALRALAKLEEGTYGVCDRCGGPIAPARLKAAPESVSCIDCARLSSR
jgi:DnaK suppressor protein